MLTYKFGTRKETVDGKVFDLKFKKKCDSDAQAELHARNFAMHNKIDGVIIQRGDVEWFVQP